VLGGQATPIVITQYYSNSVYNSQNAVHYMFEGGATNGWGNSQVIPSHVSWTYSALFAASQYTLERTIEQFGGWSNNAYSPRDWMLLGTSDPSAPAEAQTDMAKWNVLDIRAGQLIALAAAPQQFAIGTPAAYRSYRLLISAASSGNWLNITNMTVT
jgi:hypothetical protein